MKCLVVVGTSTNIYRDVVLGLLEKLRKSLVS